MLKTQNMGVFSCDTLFVCKYAKSVSSFVINFHGLNRLSQSVCILLFADLWVYWINASRRLASRCWRFEDAAVNGV